MLSDLAFALAADGNHDVHVITSRQRYDAPAEQLPETETFGGVAVRRVWTSSFGRAGLAGRAIDYLRAKGNMAILLVEQYFEFARDLADDFFVMDRGAVVLAGARETMVEQDVRRHMSV